ncbi:MAG: DUF3794 domain-containing protein [Clostridia bacterium]|nr:DUF3794 domain-containing protein [Clostridia bacterium]
MIQPKYGAIPCAKLLKNEVKVRVEAPFTDLKEVKKPISVFAKSFLISKESKSGSVIAKAKVVFTLVYLSDDGYKKSVCEVDATSEIPLENAVISVKTTDVKLVINGGYIGVANVVFIGEGRAISQNNLLFGGENLICRRIEKDVDIYYNEKKGQQVVTDEFDLDFTVGEVLSYTADAHVLSVYAGLGRIICEGEVFLSVKALPFSENNDIVNEKRIIPYRYELEDGDALPDMRCYAQADVVATNVRIYADEDKQKSSVSVDVTLSFTGSAVGSAPYSLVSDAYSKDSECELSVEKIQVLRFKEQKFFTEKIVVQGSPALEGGKILSVLGETVNVFGVKSQGEIHSVEGTVKADVIFKNEDNGIISVPCEAPFFIDFSADGVISSVSVAKGDFFARVKGGEVEIECHLKVYYKVYAIDEISAVKEICEIGERKNLGGAISVCIARRGDEIWDVAKRLGTDEDEILKFNPDIVAPMTGEERIIVYRQKI